eukprot:g16884.t1
MREALVACGQAPHSAVLGCADSRVPIDTVFDALPGDLFVLRNAGNTCTHAEGSMVGSLEFCVSKLKTRLILVLGHTECGAIAGAAQTFMQNNTSAPGESALSVGGSALEGLLLELTHVAQNAAEELGPGVELQQLAQHAVKVNVFHSIDFLLRYSNTLRSLVNSGDLEIQGGIYHLATGRVEFLGRSPRQVELMSSQQSLPPSMSSLPIRTTGSSALKSEEALQLLKEGNKRFTNGSGVAGKITPGMRKALVKDGQAPHSAVIGCADSRAPLETVFDAMPGDLFVLRNAGNTCTHAEGSILGSLEFCTAALKTKLILSPPVSKALDALLDGLSVVAMKAQKELADQGCAPSEEEIAQLAVKLNVFHTIDFLLQYSAVVREKVPNGEVDIQGGIVDLETGRVEFLGRSPKHQELLKSGLALPPSIKSDPRIIPELSITSHLPHLTFHMIRCDSFHRTCASLQGEVALLDVTRSELPGFYEREAGYRIISVPYQIAGPDGAVEEGSALMCAACEDDAEADSLWGLEGPMLKHCSDSSYVFRWMRLSLRPLWPPPEAMPLCPGPPESAESVAASLEDFSEEDFPRGLDERGLTPGRHLYPAPGYLRDCAMAHDDAGLLEHFLDSTLSTLRSYLAANEGLRGYVLGTSAREAFSFAAPDLRPEQKSPQRGRGLWDGGWLRLEDPQSYAQEDRHRRDEERSQRSASLESVKAQEAKAERAKKEAPAGGAPGPDTDGIAQGTEAAASPTTPAEAPEAPEARGPVAEADRAQAQSERTPAQELPPGPWGSSRAAAAGGPEVTHSPSHYCNYLFRRRALAEQVVQGEVFQRGVLPILCGRDMATLNSMRCDAQTTRRLVEREAGQLKNIDQLDSCLTMTFGCTLVIWILGLNFFDMVGMQWIRSWETHAGWMPFEDFQNEVYSSYSPGEDGVPKGAWDVLDVHQGGSVSERDLKVFMTGLRNPIQRPEQVKYSFQGLDLDQERRDAGCSKLMGKEGQHSAEQAFGALDLNGDGYAARGELLNALGQLREPMRGQDARVVFQGVDANEDGVVEFPEFKAAFEYAREHEGDGTEPHKPATRTNPGEENVEVKVAPPQEQNDNPRTRDWDELSQDEMVRFAKAFVPPLTQTEALFAHKGMDINDDGRVVPAETWALGWWGGGGAGCPGAFHQWKEAEVSSFKGDQEEDIRVFCGIWNLHGKRAPSDLHAWVPTNTRHHIYAIGTCECERSIEKSLIWSSKARWERQMQDYFGEDYKMIGSHTMSAVHVMIFLHRTLWRFCSEVETCHVATGFANCIGNKGSTQAVWTAWWARSASGRQFVCANQQYLKALEELGEESHRELKLLIANVTFEGQLLELLEISGDWGYGAPLVYTSINGRFPHPGRRGAPGAFRLDWVRGLFLRFTREKGPQRVELESGHLRDFSSEKPKGFYGRFEAICRRKTLERVRHLWEAPDHASDPEEISVKVDFPKGALRPPKLPDWQFTSRTQHHHPVWRKEVHQAKVPLRRRMMLTMTKVRAGGVARPGARAVGPAATGAQSTVAVVRHPKPLQIRPTMRMLKFQAPGMGGHVDHSGACCRPTGAGERFEELQSASGELQSNELPSVAEKLASEVERRADDFQRLKERALESLLRMKRQGKLDRLAQDSFLIFLLNSRDSQICQEMDSAQKKFEAKAAQFREISAKMRRGMMNAMRNGELERLVGEMTEVLETQAESIRSRVRKGMLRAHRRGELQDLRQEFDELADEVPSMTGCEPLSPMKLCAGSDSDEAKKKEEDLSSNEGSDAEKSAPALSSWQPKAAPRKRWADMTTSSDSDMDAASQARAASRAHWPAPKAGGSFEACLGGFWDTEDGPVWGD